MEPPSYATVRRTRRSRDIPLRRVTPDENLLPNPELLTLNHLPSLQAAVPSTSDSLFYENEAAALRSKIAKRRREGGHMVCDDDMGHFKTAALKLQRTTPPASVAGEEEDDWGVGGGYTGTQYTKEQKEQQVSQQFILEQASAEFLLSAQASKQPPPHPTRTPHTHPPHAPLAHAA